MKLSLRRGVAADAHVCGRICFEAFANINRQHGFPPDFPSQEVADGLMQWVLTAQEVHSVIAEVDGRIVGSNFLWFDGPIAGVGPITVDPTVQENNCGRSLMAYVLEIADRHGAAGVRLVQAAFNCRSMALYTKLGFAVREPLLCLHGQPPRQEFESIRVRAAVKGDVDAAAALCRQVHGHDRSVEVARTIAQGTARIAEREGRLTGYASDIGFFGHAVGLTNDDVKALIAAATQISGPGLLLPSRNSELLRWCLEAGLRIVQPMTLMSRGLYNEPNGAFLPSILY